MTNYDPAKSGYVQFEAPIVDYVKFANKFWVYLANGKTYISDDGMTFHEVTVTISRGATA